MGRLFRVWEKKRGQRRTGSPWVASVGEAIFFGAIFLLGVVSLVTLITSWVMNSAPPLLYQSSVVFWLLILVLTSFVAIGGSGVSFTIFRVGASPERRSAIAKQASDIDLLSDALPSLRDFPTVPRDTNVTDSPGTHLRFRLPMAYSPGWRLAAVTTFCVVWNAIAAVLLVITAQGHIRGEPQVFVTIFTIPFLAIGLWSIYHFISHLWIHTGIGPTSIEISTHPLAPSSEFRVCISQAGHMSVHSFQVRLVCEEEACFTQGTDTRTETRLVYDELLFEQSDFQIRPPAPFTTEFAARIPHDAMHSFQSAHNRVKWRIIFDCEADQWPPFQRRFQLVVYPYVQAGGEP